MAHADRRSAAARYRHLLRPAGILAAVVGCNSVTAPAERVFGVEVAEQRVPCVGVGPRACLQVREQAGAPWQLFYTTIEGFAYEPGFRYVLRVAERPIRNPPADGSSLAYRLLDVVSKAPAP